MVKPNAYMFNGTKAVNINNLPEDAWDIISGDEPGDEDITRIYKESAFFRRCVDIRGLALSNLPRDIMRGEDALEAEDIEAEFPQLADLDTWLFQIEIASVLYAQAYFEKTKNLLDQPLGLRWFAPKSIDPQYDNGLIGFKRVAKKGKVKDLSIEEVLYFWTPPIDTEVGPGPAEGKAAVRAASVLESLTTFSKQFFDRGAVFPLLLSVDGNPPSTEMQKLEAWWKQIFRGVADAWKSIAIKASISPVQIGPAPEQMAMKDLTELQRENVATGLGVPHSLVLSNAANFSVSQQDYINFYDLVLGPRARLVQRTFNSQFFEDLGLRLVFQPKRLEVFQQQNLKDSDNLVSLVSGKILERNEARDVLGYEAIEDEIEEPEPPTLVQLPRVPEPVEDEPDALRKTDLEKWQRKALKSLNGGKSAATPFTSNVLSYAETNTVLTELSLCFSDAEVNAVFNERFREFSN